MQLGYVILYVGDLEATVVFYEQAFGLTRRFIHESGYAEMETGATALAFATENLADYNDLRIRPNRKSDALSAGAEIALVTDDVTAAYARAVAAGAIATREPQRKPWGQTVAYVRDLNGFNVELCSPMST